jgi:hypothetical protein
MLSSEKTFPVCISLNAISGNRFLDIYNQVSLRNLRRPEESCRATHPKRYYLDIHNLYLKLRKKNKPCMEPSLALQVKNPKICSSYLKFLPRSQFQEELSKVLSG